MKVQVDSLNAIYEDRGDENGDENVCKVDEDQCPMGRVFSISGRVGSGIGKNTG